MKTMSKFLKEHTALRITLILGFFLIGLVLTVWGWSMTGKLSGLVIMLLGVAFLLAALYIYNKQFQDSKKK